MGQLEGVESEGARVVVRVFRDVGNAKAVRAKLLKGAFHCALLDGAMVADVFHLQVAALRAHKANATGSMSTNTVFTEIVYRLAAIRSISDALRTFGVSNNSKTIVAVFLNPNDEHVEQLQQAVEGVLVEEPDFAHFADVAKLKAFYKVEDDEERASSLSAAISTRIALFDCT